MYREHRVDSILVSEPSHLWTLWCSFSLSYYVIIRFMFIPLTRLLNSSCVPRVVLLTGDTKRIKQVGMPVLVLIF